MPGRTTVIQTDEEDAGYYKIWEKSDEIVQTPTHDDQSPDTSHQPPTGSDQQPTRTAIII